MRKVIAIDFDGCLCENRFPEIGPPCWRVIDAAKKRQQEGWALVLWTCREGENLAAAVSACKGWGLTFDAVNEPLPEWREAYQNDTRKIGATEYWDDKVVYMPAAAQPNETGAAIRFFLEAPDKLKEALHKHPVVETCLKALYEKARRDASKGTVFYDVTRNKYELAGFIAQLQVSERDDLTAAEKDELRRETERSVLEKLCEGV